MAQVIYPREGREIVGTSGSAVETTAKTVTDAAKAARLIEVAGGETTICCYTGEIINSGLTMIAETTFTAKSGFCYVPTPTPGPCGYASARFLVANDDAGVADCGHDRHVRCVLDHVLILVAVEVGLAATPGTGPADVLFYRGARDKAAKNGRIPPGRNASRKYTRAPRNILPTKNC